MKGVVSSARGKSKQSRIRQRSCKGKPKGVKGWQKKELRALRAKRYADKEERIGWENIHFVLSFSNGANIYTLRNMDTDDKQKLRRLLESYYDDEIFDAEFPEKCFESFLNENGKMLQATEDGDRREYFRQKTLLLCAGKLYDMLMGSSFRKTLSMSYGGSCGTEPAIYDEMFKTAVSVAHPEKYDDACQYIAGVYHGGAQVATA